MDKKKRTFVAKLCAPRQWRQTLFARPKNMAVGAKVRPKGETDPKAETTNQRHQQKVRV